MAQAGRSASPDSRWTVCGVCFFLAAITLMVFSPALHSKFVNFDDNIYVYQNPEVISGLNLKSIEWAFTHAVSDNWHPLTMMSHMLDCQLYGLNPGWHHLTSLLLHTAAVIGLFLVLRKLTGVLWPSAFVAAVFAVHPLRVESVAWVSERKDVLSGLFFMLTLAAYGHYVRNPKSIKRYLVVMLVFALGLMSKPMLITTPFVLLLLDYWPLRRFEQPASNSNWIPRRLIVEKIPLLLLSSVFCVVTILVQRETIKPMVTLPLLMRIGNALVSYTVYLGQMFYPLNLAVFYPYPVNGLALWKILLALLTLTAVSMIAFHWRRKYPCLLVGWLWYLGMLVPVIGLVQVGEQAHADRYTYLPQIGLYLMVAYGVADLFARWRFRLLFLGSLSILVVSVLIFCARIQVSYWKDSQTLWTHALAVTSGNYDAYNNLGNTLLRMGQVDEAIADFQNAIKFQHGFASAHYNLGNALLQKGESDEAIASFQKALEIDPTKVEAENNLGIALAGKGLLAEAITHYQRALKINPDKADTYNNLGAAYLQKGQVNDAIAQFQTAVKLKPDYAQAHYNLGNALFQEGQTDQALAEYQMSVDLEPDFARGHHDFGIALFKEGRVDEAIVQFQKAVNLQPDYAQAHYNLGAALLQKGRMDEALIQYQKTVDLEPSMAMARGHLGNVLFQEGRVDEAIVQLQKALELQPDNPYAIKNLGQVAWTLATSPTASVRDGSRALKLAQQLDQLSGGENPVIRRTLAAALAETGKFPEALDVAGQALTLATTQTNSALANSLQAEMKSYQANQPLRNTAPQP
jgi:tetratricopeptide (TPR) repeat protein